MHDRWSGRLLLAGLTLILTWSGPAIAAGDDVEKHYAAAVQAESAREFKAALAAWEAVRQLPVALRPVDIPAALHIAIQLNLYAYDAYFLVCAKNLRSPLLTLDRGMQKAALEIGITTLE